jgi:1-acyl-sn-glycerol-3-phosphate acyltransferase
MAWLWRIIAPWGVPLLKSYLKIKTVAGKEHVPKKGAAIIASNHLSGLDHLVLPVLTKRVIYNISKAEHFQKRGRAFFFRNVGVIPLQRGTGDKGAIEKAKEILSDGNLFCIYPEGTRSRDGHLHKGHTGVARLALELGVPVVPVAMLGTFEKKPKGKKGMHKEVKVGARAGEPLTWPHYAGKHEDRGICREVTDEIMLAIAAVSGQKYVDEYQHNPEVPGYDRK